jgi:hypothetical protein
MGRCEGGVGGETIAVATCSAAWISRVCVVVDIILNGIPGTRVNVTQSFGYTTSQIFEGSGWLLDLVNVFRDHLVIV